MLQCREVEGVSYIEADFRQQCFTTRWKHALLWAVPFTVMYFLGIPVFLFVLVQRSRHTAARQLHLTGISPVDILFNGKCVASA
jgi:hypothetical protein